MSVLPTSASGSSSSPGLPTPRARDARGRGFADQLPNVVELLPTPTVSEANGIGHAADSGMNLRHTISLLPTPRASENENRQTKRSPSQEAGTHGKCLAAEVAHLLPTPTVADSNGTRNFQTDGTPYGSGYGKTLTDATTLLPTPRATDGTKGGPNQRGSSGDLMLPSAVHRMSSGASTEQLSDAGSTSSDDSPPPPTDALGRLAPPFVEWMMGLPAGHVTAVPGLPRGAQLKALGNGVVPQQAAAALRVLAARADAGWAVAS
jgi:hypothetical protein